MYNDDDADDDDGWIACNLSADVDGGGVDRLMVWTGFRHVTAQFARKQLIQRHQCVLAVR